MAVSLLSFCGLLPKNQCHRIARPVTWVLGLKSLTQGEKELILWKNLERLDGHLNQTTYDGYIRRVNLSGAKDIAFGKRRHLGLSMSRGRRLALVPCAASAPEWHAALRGIQSWT